MKKTKTLLNALKTLFLTFALCLFVATESDAQSFASDNYEYSDSQTDQTGVSDFFQWVESIFTGDDSSDTEDLSGTSMAAGEERSPIRKGNIFIVTDDMSIRDNGF